MVRTPQWVAAVVGLTLLWTLGIITIFEHRMAKTVEMRTDALNDELQDHIAHTEELNAQIQTLQEELAKAKMSNQVEVLASKMKANSGKRDSGSAPIRMLSMFTNVAGLDAATASTGCITVEIDMASVSLDLSTKACGPQAPAGHRCPPCFIVTKGSDTNQLSLTNCQQMYVSSDMQMGTGPLAATVATILLINSDSMNMGKPAKIWDGVREITIPAKGMMPVVCYTGGGAGMYSPDGGGSSTGSTGSSVTQADGDFKVMGNLEVVGTLSTSGVASINGGYAMTGSGVTINAQGGIDTNGPIKLNGGFQGFVGNGVTISDIGGLSMDGALSAMGMSTMQGGVEIGGGFASMGATLSNTGAISATGNLQTKGTLAVSGQSTVSGELKLASGLTIGGGYQPAQNSGFTLSSDQGGSISMGGPLHVNGMSSFQGMSFFGSMVTLGDEAADMITVKGNLKGEGMSTFDWSQSGAMSCNFNCGGTR